MDNMRGHHKRALTVSKRLVYINMIVALLFGINIPSTAAQPPDDSPKENQLFLPFIDHQVEDGSEDEPDITHQSDDLVNIPMEQQEAAADPNAGVISNELQAAAVTGPPNEVGEWSPVYGTSVVPVFVAMMPNGNVLMWDSVGDNPTEDYDDHSFTRAAIWDPVANSSYRVDAGGANLFCAGYTHLSDGRLFLAGGNKNAALDGIKLTHIFDHNTNSWSRGPDMDYERWYPSVAAMPNEDLYIMGGGPAIHELYEPNNTVRTLWGAYLDHTREYPFIQSAPDGRVLYAGPQSTMRMLSMDNNGTWQTYGNRDSSYRSYGSYAMYDIGKVIVTGGIRPATKSARVIDVLDGSPSVRGTSPMIYARRQHNLTILPDGSVLATGGFTGSEQLIDLDRGVYAAEVWNPATEQWTELASMSVTRQYHSAALLLPDGRVMVGGGGICGDCFDVGYLRKDIEIFSPPYLFNSSGNLATRPTVTSAPTAIGFGQSFTINTSNASSINKISLVRLGAPTHSQDMGQRFVPISFSQSGNTLTADAPTNANIAPPGYYMLFVVNNSGVPSVAKFVRVDDVTVQPPTPTPTPVPQQPTPTPAPQQPTPTPTPLPQQPTPTPTPPPNSSDSTIALVAFGQEGGEVMQLRIDGSTVKTWTVTQSPTTYSYNHSQAVSAGQISVHFTNDESDFSIGYDKNLYVDKLILDGTTYQTEDATVEGQGVWTGTNCSAIDFHQSEVLACDGYFKYAGNSNGGGSGGGGSGGSGGGSGGGDGSDIKLYAFGDEGGEKMELHINGSTVKTWTVTQSMQEFSYTHDSEVSASQVSVHFTNDQADFSIGFDMNLNVDRVVIDGTTYQTEAASVEGQGPWTGSNCSTVAFHQKEKLVCNGYFSY